MTRLPACDDFFIREHEIRFCYQLDGFCKEYPAACPTPLAPRYEGPFYSCDALYHDPHFSREGCFISSAADHEAATNGLCYRRVRLNGPFAIQCTETPNRTACIESSRVCEPFVSRASRCAYNTSRTFVYSCDNAPGACTNFYRYNLRLDRSSRACAAKMVAKTTQSAQITTLARLSRAPAFTISNNQTCEQHFNTSDLGTAFFARFCFHARTRAPDGRYYECILQNDQTCVTNTECSLATLE